MLIFFRCNEFCLSEIDWAAYDKECTAHLPVYARPAFVRISATIALTSTFKHQKGQLAKEGYALSRGSMDSSSALDPVYFYNVKDHSVVILTVELEKRINTGLIQL